MGNDKQQHADSLLQIEVIPNICTKFQNPRRSSWEIFDTNFPMYYIGVRDWKKEKWKEKVKINLSILIFYLTIYLATLKVHKKFEDSGSHRSREICNRKFDWREEKWTNKGNSKHQVADSLLHNTTSHTQHLYQTSKSEVQLFLSEKSLTQISLYITFEWEMEKKEKWKKKAKNLSILIFFPTIYRTVPL